MNNTTIFKTKQQLAINFGELLHQRSQQNNKVTIALSGGSTPKAIFDELTLNFKDKIDWSKIHLFWGDERCVPPSHHESNYRMTQEHLITKVSIPEENIHRIQGELEVNKASQSYINHLNTHLPIVNDLPQFDIVILGMGTDGHTASIFPYQIELWDTEAICVPAQHPESGQNRVSLTGKIINHAKEIYFLVTGQDKADKVSDIIQQKGNFKSYPASLVKNPIWLMDEDAAKHI